MLRGLITASAAAGGLLIATMQLPAQAMPVVKANTMTAVAPAVTLAGHRPGGGGGLKMGGGGGHGPAMHGGGGGLRLHGGGGGPRVHGGGGGGIPRFAHKGGGPKVWKGPKFSGDFKHHHKGHHGHRRFRGFAYYGAPNIYSYGYGSCEWLYRKAVRTGSRYWWNRYYDCRDRYYDYY